MCHFCCMTDPTANILTKLLATASVTALTGTDRVVGGIDLPDWYVPSQGGLVLVTVRGGPRGRGTAPIMRPAVWTRSYAATDLAAIALDRVVVKALDLASVGGSLVGETLSQPAQQEQTGWPFVLSIFRLTMPF